MSTLSNQKNKENQEDLKKFYFEELKFIFDRLKFYDQLRASTLIFIVTASLTLVGIAVENSNLIFLFAAIGILVFFIIFDRRCRRSLISYYSCAYVILDNLRVEDKDTVFHINCTPLSDEGRRIVDEYQSLIERKKAIQKTKVVNKGFFFIAPIIALFFEVIGVIFWFFFDNWM